MTIRGSVEVDEGFSLVEVTVATLLTGSVIVAIAGAVLAAASSVVRSRDHSLATVLARARLEQLRSLAWGAGDARHPISVSDMETDLSGPALGGGGAGLGISPSASLTTNAPAYVDFLNRDGVWLRSGSPAPAGAMFVRRWSVSALPGSADALVLQVVVSPLRNRATDTLWPGDVRLVAVKGRKAS